MSDCARICSEPLQKFYNRDLTQFIITLYGSDKSVIYFLVFHYWDTYSNAIVKFMSASFLGNLLFQQMFYALFQLYVFSISHNIN